MLVSESLILRGQVILKEYRVNPRRQPSPKGYTKQLDKRGSRKPCFAGLRLALLNLSFPLSRVPSGRLALMRHSDSWANVVTKSKITF